VRRAIARGGLTAEGWCVAESFHLLEEALRSDCGVKTILVAESVRSAAEAHVRRLAGIKVAVLPDALFQTVAGTESSQGVMALVVPPEWRLEQLFRGNSLVVVLDGLQDPGNAGAILRAAEAFGATGAMFLKGTVSPFNPKTLRASAGSLFRVPFLHGMDPELARAALQQNKVELYAAVPARPDGLLRPLGEVDLTGRCGLIIGNEARGVSGELRSAALDVSIPTVGVESLNAAVAAGILLYEARRQRAARR
jgi:TrmH family RNA methyltransferase